MKRTFLTELLAGLTVSFAALSLGAAFGVMSGRGAFSGMIGAAVIPIITSILGGTRIQASGPTAPMTAVTAVVVAFAHDRFSDQGQNAEQLITLTLLLSAAILFLFALLRLGKYIKLVPQVVVLGFMNGIALLIWADQLKKLFGWGGVEAVPGPIAVNAAIAFGTLGMIYAVPRLLKRSGISPKISKYFPAILLTLVIMTLITSMMELNVGHVKIDNNIDGFSSFIALISSYFPNNPELYSADILWLILPYAFQLAILAYLDSLLTSLVVDKMTSSITKANRELMAQGTANAISAIFQGIPGAQATIRSVLLIKEGASTRLAGVFVGIFALIGFLAFSSWIGLIASAVFVGILFKAGLDVMDRDFILAYYKYKWIKNKSRNIQFFIILLTTLITVFFDLNIAVLSGTVLFYVLKKTISLKDAEDDFSQVEAEELLGVSVEEN